MKLTEQERNHLESCIIKWRDTASQIGSQHTLWDRIWDAEALLMGMPTVLDGTPHEIYLKLTWQA